ncbi:MAG TPA: nitroreductase family protein [Candidatus Limnocylindrales bacterium]|nr:nitroreductase family protein [Candidatus Limnocylindrales bacterium]
MEFAEVVKNRRMVRHFAADPVPREVLERIAAAAQRAPSAGFSQGQRLVIVTDPGRRRRLAELSGEAFYTGQGFDPWISEAPALFVPAVSAQVYVDRYNEPDKRDPSLPPGTEEDWDVPYWWMDVGCTVMLVLLAAVDEGLAAGFAGGDFDAIRDELGMPEHFAPVGVIPVGRPLPDKKSPSLKRGWRGLDDFVRWETW